MTTTTKKRNHPNRGLVQTKYKLVTQDYTTHNDTRWKDEDGKWLLVEAQEEGTEMCTDQLVHFYDHPVLAVLFNPIHADIKNPRLLSIKTSRTLAHDGLKGGAKKAQGMKELPLPVLTTEQRVEFAIRVSMEVMLYVKLDCPAWFDWAKKWLSGEDRAAMAAEAAARAAMAAWADAMAAEAAAWADARAAMAAEAAWADARAARAAARAAWADARAARAARAAMAAAKKKAARWSLKLFVRVIKEMKVGTTS